MNKIDAIVIHCLATRAGQDVRVAYMGMLLEGVLWQDGEEEKPADAQEEKPERRGGGSMTQEQNSGL